MSLQFRATSSNTSKHGRSAATDRSSSRSTSDSGEAERRPEEDKATRANEEKGEAEEQQAEQSRKKSTKDEMQGYLNKDYRTLLNSVIAEAAGVHHPDESILYPSQVGTSFWTAEEKESFFHALAIKGRDNLPGISRAVKTKDELEVRAYLLALEVAISGSQVSSPGASDTSSTGIAAAYEIRDRCEHALNLTAEALERHVLQHEIELEKEKFGDLWLIDEDAAAKIKLDQQANELVAAARDDEQVRETSDESSFDSESEDNDVDVKQQRADDVSKHVSIAGEVAATALLKPEAFLQLSRTLFMNSATDAESSWHQLVTVDGEVTTPALFRSAFENFHNITVNFTRWIVQATMFQAMSRLRAKDDQNPAAIVTTADVKTAISFLNLNSDREKYWAGVARRCGVDVYSDSDKFKDGRPGTKNGRLLTWDEVEGELGFPPDAGPADIAHKIEEDEDESASSDSSDQESAEADGISDKEEHLDASSPNNFNATNKRTRSGSSSSESDVEDQRMDSLDEQASRAEERRLMEMLRYSASPSPDLETEHVLGSRSTSRGKRIKLDRRSDWRENMDYMADWEQRRTSHESR